MADRCNECGMSDSVYTLLDALALAEQAVTRRDGVFDAETFDAIWTEATYQAWLNYKRDRASQDDPSAEVADSRAPIKAVNLPNLTGGEQGDKKGTDLE